MEKTIGFMASGPDGANYVGSSPKEAAEGYFSKYPNKRKCDVHEGLIDGHFFTLVMRKNSQRWKDITKKTFSSLPANRGEACLS